MNLSTLISLPVINIFQAKHQGIINNLLFDTNTKALKYISLISNDDENYVIDVKNIYKISNSAVMIKNENVVILAKSVQNELENLHSPINSSVYTPTGIYKDMVIDVQISNNYKIQKFITKCEQIDISKIYTFNNSVTICYDDKKIKISNFKPLSQPKHYIQSDKNPNVQILDQIILPKKEIVNYNYLINRKVDKNIVDNNNKIIIRQNSIITDNIINIASVHNKLIELISNSKKI